MSQIPESFGEDHDATLKFLAEETKRLGARTCLMIYGSCVSFEPDNPIPLTILKVTP